MNTGKIVKNKGKPEKMQTIKEEVKAESRDRKTKVIQDKRDQDKEKEKIKKWIGKN